MANKQWVLKTFSGFDALESREQPIPSPDEYSCLVRHHAASLNYRDLIIAKGTYPLNARPGIVPASDGAGEIVSVGSMVTKWKKGDRVCGLFNQLHHFGELNRESAQSGLGGGQDGVLQQFRVYHELSLVKMPDYMSYEQAATLPCAALTAYNALYGLAGRPLNAGDWVLTQGTGGVSIWGVAIAKAAGARVVATTSSADKTEVLKKLGADVVLNYKTNPNWGKEAKRATGGRGVDYIIEVGGPGTMKQSLDAITIGGIICVIGFVGTPTGDEPTASSILRNMCMLRSVLVGSRVLFEQMNRALEVWKVQPVIDTVFAFDKVREAYEYQWQQKHIGKVVLDIP